MNGNTNIVRKLRWSIFVVIILVICLCATTYALVLATISVNNNEFQTGTVQINLNDGNPVIEEHEFLFEPGMTVVKDFFVENESSCDVYYRLYFSEIQGGLADVLEITVLDGAKVVYSGLASGFTKENVNAASEILRMDERCDLTMILHFPESAGNETQNLTLSFVICADAVQTKNNPEREFD